MNYNELKALVGWCNAVGIKTAGELKRFVEYNHIRGNNELLNKLNEFACRGIIWLGLSKAVA
ncbi:MAG: M2 family metallopeptidase [Christensenellaceae bacterium]|jgi:hypothetical protein|nr:M2 family metallopeptidase [Christensenellaceae bacterium]